MATVDGLVSRVRLELGDLATNFTTTLTGTGGTEYYVKAKPLEILGLSVKVNGVTQPQNGVGATGYTVDAMRGVITLNTAAATTDTIVVSGVHYRYFTTDDLTTFVSTAITQHTYNRTDNYGRQMTVTLLPGVEEYPIVILASVEALWALATDASFDINITAPDGVVIPRNQRFTQLSQIIAQRKAQYTELCAALNIGLYRIEMATLRRVSRTTNKLVPVYVPQEIDDSRKPERVYVPNDLMGRVPTPTTAQVYDIVLVQGDYWEAEFDFPNTMEALENYTIKAQVRTYPESPTLIASFNISLIYPIHGTGGTGTVSGSGASTTILDSAIATTDVGLLVSGTNIPSGAKVGTVTAGTSFILVNSAGTPITPTGAVSSVSLIGNTHKLLLALTPDISQKLPLKAYWDLQFTKSTGGNIWYEWTPIKGQVFADRQVTNDGTAPSSVVHIAGSVRTVSTYNISLSGVMTIDGVTLANGDRVLVNGQTDKTQNGIYIVNSSGAWARASDANSSSTLIPGLQVFVDKGATTYGETGWVLNNTTPVNVGADVITFVNTIQKGWNRN